MHFSARHNDIQLKHYQKTNKYEKQIHIPRKSFSRAYYYCYYLLTDHILLLKNWHWTKFRVQSR